jgi:hypothetical protein
MADNMAGLDAAYAPQLAVPCWRLPVTKAILLVMDKTNLDDGQSPYPEPDADRRRRIAWEADRIAEADAELAAGLYVDADEVRAWINSLRTDTPLPPPPTRHR